MGPGHRRVVWAEAAAASLDEAIAFVAADSPAGARVLLDRVLQAAGSLATLADRGASVPEVDDSTVRQLLPQPYRLIYRVEEDQVMVLAVLHQREDRGLWSRQERRS